MVVWFYACPYGYISWLILTSVLQYTEADCVFGSCVCPEGYELTEDQEECVLTSGKLPARDTPLTA